MTVLFVNPAAGLGGAERSLLDLIASLKDVEPTLDLHVALPARGDLADAVEGAGARVHILPMPAKLETLGDSAAGAVAVTRRMLLAAPSILQQVRRLRTLVRELEPDIVHSNGFKSHVLCELAVPKRIPLIWHVRDFISSRRMVGRLLAQLRSRRTRIIANSAAVAEDVARVIPGERPHVMYNGIDVETFAPGGPIAELDTANDVMRIGLAATYARWKGQDLFIKAAASVAARLPKNSVRFYIIGGPIYATPGSQFQPDELRKLGTELGLGPELAFVGFQQSMAEVYRALNIVVHASTRPEPFGRTIVEAMACGRAVIVSNAGGAMELFTEGHDALGIPPCDVNALAEAMIRLIQDRGLRDVLGRNARQTACARFDRRRLGSEMIKIYDHEHALR